MFNGWPCTMRDSTSKSFVTNLKLAPMPQEMRSPPLIYF